MALAIVVATVLSYAVGWFVDISLLVPILNTIASFPFMVLALRKRDVKLAISRMLVWAATMAVCATVLSYLRPILTDRLFVGGLEYKNEMFTWVQSGHGAESSPSLFMPRQARDAAIFSVLAVATGGVAAMPMGAVLTNEMGHYAGALAARSYNPVPTLILAWHPWAIIRVVSFVVIGVVLSMPVLGLFGQPSGAGRRSPRAASPGGRVLRSDLDWRGAARTYLPWAAGGLALDVILKSLLAPAWQRMLLSLVGR